MNHLKSLALGLALVAAPTVAVAQSGTETFQVSGFGYTSVTVDYDMQSITYHYANGGQFTQGVTDSRLFAALVKMFRDRQSFSTAPNN